MGDVVASRVALEDEHDRAALFSLRRLARIAAAPAVAAAAAPVVPVCAVLAARSVAPRGVETGERSLRGGPCGRLAGELLGRLTVDHPAKLHGLCRKLGLCNPNETRS